jgi:large subunit ribosomal protein L22
MYGKDITGNTAKAMIQNAKVSFKSSKFVCAVVRGLEVRKAKKLLEDVIDEKRSINGKYYTNICMELLDLIKSAEKNAEFKNLDTNNMFVAHVVSMKGTTMRRRRHKNKIGNKLKATHFEVILKERPIAGAEKKAMEKKAPEKKDASKETATEKIKESIKETVKAEIKKKEEVKLETKKEEAKPKTQAHKTEIKTEKKATEAPKAEAKKETAHKAKKPE